ncbi:MAG: metal ABC transporter solute-binding protein, Zn/Mn family [Aristaeellaceae bacterium]
MMKLRRMLCLLLALILLPVASLAETVVTSFYPIYLFALNLTDGLDGVSVHNLAAPGTGCLHDYQLQTGDMKKLAQADVFLINGAGMESFLPGVTDAFPELMVVDASEGIDLLDAQVEGVVVADHADHDDHDHDHDGSYNAHIWLDAANAQQMVRNLADGLITALPQHAEALAANRDAYLTRLAALDEELKAGTAELAHRDIITFHEAFPYFAQAYGLNVAAVVNREPGDALSPARLAELVNVVRELGAPPLFVEPQYDDMAARTLSTETGAPVYELDPVVTGPDQNIPLTYYEDIMRQNLSVLQQALR